MNSPYKHIKATRRLRSAVGVCLAGIFSLGMVYSALADITNNAKAVGEYNNLPIESNTSTQTVPVNTLTPQMSISITDDYMDDDNVAGLSAGDNIIYEIIVSNTGDQSLTNVVLSDALVQNGTTTNLNLTFDPSSDTNGDGKLNPGENFKYTVSYEITQPNIDNGGNLVNTVSVTSDHLTPQVASNTYEFDSTTLVSSYTMEKIATLADTNSNTLGDLGETINYTFRFKNTGNYTLTNLKAIDTLANLSAITCSNDGDNDGDIDSLTPTLQAECSASIVISADHLDLGKVDNVATSTATKADGVTAVIEDNSANDNETSTPISMSYELAVNSEAELNDNDGINGVSAGDTVEYAITVTNTGTGDITNASITGNLAQGTNSQVLVPVLDLSSDTNGDGILSAGEEWVYILSYTLTDDNVNEGTPLTYAATLTSLETEAKNFEYEQALTGFIDSYDLVVTSELQDGDGDGKGDVGESVEFTFTYTNTGSRDLSDLIATSSLAGMSNIICTNDANGDGKIDALSVGQSVSCTASYTLTQDDIDAGQLENTVTASAKTTSGSDLAPGNISGNGFGSVELSLDALAALEFEKTLSKMEGPFPAVYDLEYTLNVENIGTTTLTNLDLIDHIKNAVKAPSEIVGDAEVVHVSGAITQADINTAYNGGTQTHILADGFNLAVGERGSVTLKVRINRSVSDLKVENDALANADQLQTAIHSDDPTITPSDPTDKNLTSLAMLDSDHDGATDDIENATGDVDGDGIPNNQDYDPTGYLFCQEDGRILEGVKITVVNETTGDSQTGVGKSQTINITSDGSNGFFQFFVSEAGRYRLDVPTPAGAKRSTTHLTKGVMDVKGFLPTNPVYLGSGEDGNSRYLKDFTPAANPFYTTFDIAEGAPAVFENNIPYEMCGNPSFEPSISIVGEPTMEPDGSMQATYRVEVKNDGSVPVKDIAIEDNLANVFGVDYLVDNVSIDHAPTGFGANVNTSYDGDVDTALLTSGGTLKVDESVVVLLDVTITAAPGEYTNVVQVRATNSIDNTPIGEKTVEVPLTVIITGRQEEVVALKTTPVVAVPLGSVVPYTITINNNSKLDMTDVEVVDFVPQGFSYVKNSAKINGSASEPEISNARELVWSKQNLAAGKTITATLSLVMGANASGTEFINSAFLRSSITGETISNVAKVSIELEVESVFQCSQIIGRVFDDLDKDGYYDKGEPGLGGVRVVSVNGLLITTDQFGRYHVACDQIPADRIGSNYILKLDERTLPTGYKVTSENPRVVRATRGKLVKLNFAAANLRVVSVELKDSSFKQGSTSLNRDAIRDIARILPILEEETSILKINYVTASEVSRVHKKKLKAVKDLVLKAWRARKRDYRLKVDTKVRGN